MGTILYFYFWSGEFRKGCRFYQAISDEIPFDVSVDFESWMCSQHRDITMI